jgi:diguanylate cyclase (GGDEF)-like protein
VTDLSRQRRVPLSALVLSLASLAVPVTANFLLPGLMQEEYGVLVWATVLVPAFLLAYHRGRRGVTIALAAGMAVLSLTHAAVSGLGMATPDWKLLGAVVVVFVAICVALGVMAEQLHRQREFAEDLSLLDPLTGLPNRRFAELTLVAQFAAATRGRRLAVVMFDLDHFKRVNDAHGHEAGDETLKGFAAVLRRHGRRMDFSGRLGGEEFISVLSDCAPQAATGFAERVRASLREHRFPWGQVTVSAGVATYQEGMASHEILVAAADRALYQAKQAGRDRVQLLKDEPAPVPAVTVPAPTTPAARILVVDDDADVLNAVAKLLAAGGFAVETTRDPETALHWYKSGAKTFDLLVTDVLMPTMTGVVMVDQILPHRPDLRVVYMSGYVQKGGVTWAGLPGGAVAFVPKPVEMQNLLDTVRDVLGRPAPTTVTP